MEISWLWREFDKLTNEELYAVLKLRQDVFVVEQQCTYQDIDAADQQAQHLLGHDSDGQLVASLRMFAPGIRCAEVSIGRVLTAQRVRGTGLGHEQMRRALLRADELYPHAAIRVNAQAHLVEFYEGHGFRMTGSVYDVDGIPHQDLVRPVD